VRPFAPAAGARGGASVWPGAAERFVTLIPLFGASSSTAPNSPLRESLEMLARVAYLIA